jgi:hypothetical protein
MDWYEIQFIKQISSGFSSLSTEDEWLEYWVDVPFVPMIGLGINIGEWEEVIEKELLWDGDRGIFVSYSRDKQRYEEELQRQPLTPMEIVMAPWLETGWKIREDYHPLRDLDKWPYMRD